MLYRNFKNCEYNIFRNKMSKDFFDDMNSYVAKFEENSNLFTEVLFYYFIYLKD